MTTPIRPRRARSGMIVAASAVVVALLGVGAWAVLSHSGAPLSISGPTMAIALIAPREPTPVEGSVMTVGALNDGFDRAALDRRPEVIDADFAPPDAYVGEDPPMLDLPYERMPPAAPPTTSAAPTKATADPLADGSRWFGFDRQRPAASVSAPAPDAPSPVAPEPAKRSEAFFQ